jgi:hypothetical protein
MVALVGLGFPDAQVKVDDYLACEGADKERVVVPPGVYPLVAGQTAVRDA